MTQEHYRADPFPFYEQVRAQGPLSRGRLAWTTADHAVCSTVLRSEDFRVGPDEDTLPAVARRLLVWSRNPQAPGPVDPPSMLAVEPPDHTRYRRLVSKVFTARAVEGLRARTQEIADDLLDRLEGRDRAELVETYAALLPVAVISEVLGVRPADHGTVLRFGNEGARSLDVGLSYRQFRAVDDAVRGFQGWLGGHLDQLRREPGDDLLSQLVRIEDEGQRLDDTELRATAGLLLAAGFETTVNLLGSGTALLLQHPDQVALLREEPALWRNAVEEALRLEGPVQMTGRMAARDTELAGQTVRSGGLVLTYLAGANRDPAVFPDPHVFDVRRANARDHLTFSAGRHFCLGAALARLEGEIGLRSLFERYPDLALDGPGRRRTTRVLRGWEALPVRLRAPAAV
jgi:cytochrome P450